MDTDTPCANFAITGCAEMVHEKGNIFCGSCTENKESKTEAKKKAEINLLREQNLKLEQENIEFREAIQERFEKMRDSNAETEMKYEMLIKKLMDENKNYLHEMQELERVNSELKNENITYHFSNDETKIRLENYERSNSSLETSIEDLNTAKCDLEQKIRELNSVMSIEKQKFDESTSNFEKSINDINEEKNELENKFQDLSVSVSTEREASENKIRVLHGMIEELKQQLESVNKENQQLKERKTRAKTPISKRTNLPSVIPRTPLSARGTRPRVMSDPRKGNRPLPVRRTRPSKKDTTAETKLEARRKRVLKKTSSRDGAQA
jgi:DNA repair exonuclease SbcCD ATPase subunit